MKLFSKYNQINVPATIIIFLAGCVGFYFVLKHVLIRQLEESLQTERTEISAYVAEHDRLPEIVNTRDQQTAFYEVPAAFKGVYHSSATIWDDKEKENDFLRQLIFGVTAQGKYYKVVVSQSQVETNDLLKLIIMIAAGVIGLILITSFIINGWVLRRLWRPFYHTISAIGKYELSEQQPLPLQASGIDEFDLLNGSIHTMTERIQHDYQVLKEFSANAAHEMQTPLAVIRTRTDELIQDEMLLQQHSQSILTIEQSVQRLTRMNQALLLLAKIENRQFVLNEKVELDELVKEKVQELYELTTAQQLQVTVDTVPVTIHFHRYLAEVILNNLFSNAIRYNKHNGAVLVTLTAKRLTISNTSPLPAMDAQKIWQRFYRHPDTLPEGSGLGLSIVKQVCEWAGYALTYHYHDGWHVFSMELATHSQQYRHWDGAPVP